MACFYKNLLATQRSSENQFSWPKKKGVLKLAPIEKILYAPLVPNNRNPDQNQANDSKSYPASFNCKGIRQKLDYIKNCMQNQEIRVEALQETNFNDKATIKAPMGYSIITEKLPKDRGKGGGLVFIIKDCVPFHTLKLSKPNGDIHIEQQTIKIETGKNSRKVINIYIPPTSSCTIDFSPSLNHLLTQDDCIIVGDFNAHNPLW